MIALAVSAAFVAGVLAGWWWNRRASLDVLKAAEATAAVAQGYAANGLELSKAVAANNAIIEESKKEITRSADERARAANALDSLDRNQGVILTALIRVGAIPTTGGGGGGGETERSAYTS